MTEAFRADVKEFAEANAIPIIKFQPGPRKDDIANRLRAERPVRDEVVFVGVAPEKAMAFSGRKRNKKRTSATSPYT